MMKSITGALLAAGLFALAPAAVTSAAANTPAATANKTVAVKLITAHRGHHHWRRCHFHRHAHKIFRRGRPVWVWHAHHHCHGAHGGHH